MFLLAKINETGRPCSAFESNIPLKPGQDIHDQSIKNNWLIFLNVPQDGLTTLSLITWTGRRATPQSTTGKRSVKIKR